MKTGIAMNEASKLAYAALERAEAALDAIDRDLSFNCPEITAQAIADRRAQLRAQDEEFAALIDPVAADQNRSDDDIAAALRQEWVEANPDRARIFGVVKALREATYAFRDLRLYA